MECQFDIVKKVFVDDFYTPPASPRRLPSRAFCLPLTREVDFAKQKTEGENNLHFISPPDKNQRFLPAPSSEGVFSLQRVL